MPDADELYSVTMTEQATGDLGPKPQETQLPAGGPSETTPKPSEVSDHESPPQTRHIVQSDKDSRKTQNRLMVFFTFVIAIASVGQAVNSYFQWDVMKEQLDLSKRQLDLSQRPWIGQEFERSITFAWNQDRWEAYLGGVFTNHGGSVALAVLNWVQVFPLDKTQQFGPAKARQQQWCDANRAPQKGFITGDVLQPKQELDTKHYLSIAEKDISENTIGLAIVGCVVYGASYDPPEQPTRQTRFSYMLSINSDKATMGNLQSKEPTTFYLVRLPALSSAD